MIEPVETRTSELRISLNAFSPLVQLAQPRRETFKEYYFNNDLKRPSVEVIPYLQKYNASRKGLMLGHQIKELLVRNLHHNKHKDFFMSGIVQAYLDMCLAISVSDYCLEDLGKELDYSEYLKTSTDSIDYCFDNIEPFQTLAGLPVLDGFQNVLTGMVNMAKDVEKSRAIAHNRIDSSFKILKLWQEQKISHNSEYEDLLTTISDKVKICSDLETLPFLLTVNRNADQYLQEEIEQVETIFSTISDKAVIEFKANKIKAEDLPTVEQAREFLNKNRANNKRSSLDELM